MAAFNWFQDFSEQLGLGAHNLNTDALYVYLSNVAPTATDTIKSTSSATEIASGNGYTTGGKDTTQSYSESGGTGSCTPGADLTWTAETGAMAQFRYCVLYNDTHASDALIGWWDNGSAVDLGVGDSFTLNFGATMFTVAQS